MSDLMILSDLEAEQVNGGAYARARGQYALAVAVDKIDDINITLDYSTRTLNGGVTLTATKGGDIKVFNGGMVGVVL